MNFKVRFHAAPPTVLHESSWQWQVQLNGSPEYSVFNWESDVKEYAGWPPCCVGAYFILSELTVFRSHVTSSFATILSHGNAVVLGMESGDSMTLWRQKDGCLWVRWRHSVGTHLGGFQGEAITGTCEWNTIPHFSSLESFYEVFLWRAHSWWKVKSQARHLSLLLI